jgi:YfiH family protein
MADFIQAFSRRQSGNMSLVYGDTADSLTNRKLFLGNLGINYSSLVCAKQIHASQIKYIDDSCKGRGALNFDTSIDDTDAFITDCPNIPLAVFTADCLSVFLYDPQKPAIGLVHAGWRGTKERIVAKAVEEMQERFKTKVELLQAFFGPLIKECCYEVGEDFKGIFKTGFKQKNSRYYLDLAGINKLELLAKGLREKNIHDSSICTSCQNNDFFSYRKEGKSCGRMISVIMLK